MVTDPTKISSFFSTSPIEDTKIRSYTTRLKATWLNTENKLVAARREKDGVGAGQNRGRGEGGAGFHLWRKRVTGVKGTA